MGFGHALRQILTLFITELTSNSSCSVEPIPDWESLNCAVFSLICLSRWPALLGNLNEWTWNIWEITDLEWQTSIYLNILKYITNLYFCQRLEFAVYICLYLLSCVCCFCKLCYINLQKCLSVCVCVCVISTPSHCYAFVFCAFYFPKSKKSALDTYVTPVCKCKCVWVNMLVPCCLCALVLVLHLCMDIFQIYASFVDFICQFL